MSWDNFVQDLPREATTTAEIPDAFRPKPIGPHAEIVKKIIEVIPTANFANPAWGLIDGGGWSIEVNLGSDEICEGFALHVRGGDEAVGAVAEILARLDLRALDSQTGEFFEAGPIALASFRKWRAYRDRSVGDGV
jgi:hypothetical protein